MSVQIQRPPGVNVGVNNPGEHVYVKGTEDVDGSVRTTLNAAGNGFNFENRVDGSWVLAPTVAESATFNRSVDVPSGTMSFGDGLTLSEGTAGLMVRDNIRAGVQTLVTSALNDTTGSSAPAYKSVADPAQFVPQPDDDVQITDPIARGLFVSPVDTTTFNLVFRTFASMTNVKIRIIDNTTEMAIRHIPSLAAWDSDSVAGIEFISGDNQINFFSDAANTPGMFNFGFTPVLFIANEIIRIEIKADAVALLGGGTVVTPYLGTLAGQITDVEIASADAVFPPIKTVTRSGGSYDAVNGDNLIANLQSGSGFQIHLPEHGDEYTIVRLEGIVEIADEWLTVFAPVGATIELLGTDGNAITDREWLFHVSDSIEFVGIGTDNYLLRR
jgi:hypothetical protein